MWYLVVNIKCTTSHLICPLYPQAASRHHCKYLVKLHEQDFLLHNGNPDWLQGIKHAPRKLQDLGEINKILAHRPWLITKDHFQVSAATGG